MIDYKPRPSEDQSDTFSFHSGMDSINDPTFLGKGKVTDLVNMDFNDYGPVARVGYTLHGNAGNSIVNAHGAILRESGDIHVRAFGTNFQKLVGATWTNVATITNKQATIVSYICSDLTTAASLSGTATSGSSSKILQVSGGSMTINTHSGKIVRVTSGTGAGQENMIVGNDLTDIFVQDSFETVPDATSVFEVRSVISHVIFTNGTDTPFKYDGTTKTDLTAWVKFHSIDVNHDRLLGTREDIDMVYISNIGSDFFPKDNFIPVNQNADSIIAIQKNHEETVIYKENSRYRLIGYDLDSFQLVTADEHIGCIARKSVTHGNNYNFFLGHGGVYSINSLDNSSTDEGIPISRDITNKILAHTAQELSQAVGWINENRYYLSVGNEVFVYHIAQSQQAKSHVWSRHTYADPIKSAFYLSGEVYLGGIQSYIVGGSSDNNTVITCTVETGDRSQKDKNRFKVYHRDYINFSRTATTVQVYVGIDGATPTLQATLSTTTTTGQMKLMINKRGKTIRYKYVFP